MSARQLAEVRCDGCGRSHISGFFGASPRKLREILQKDRGWVVHDGISGFDFCPKCAQSGCPITEVPGISQPKE